MTEDVPGYRVLEQVGEGGFSVVYRAHQERLDRTVALKVLSVGAVDTAAMRRFQRECKITGRLSGHPNIVTVLDTGTTRGGRPYIAMEYFEHGALTDRLAAEGPLPVADVLRIGVKMAGALAATHETDVLHRDVKPQNVLLSRYGEPALADFGIARLTDSFDATHTQAFTPNHAAPEVLEGRPPGTGADVYSLGSTLYQLLAGRPAFKGPPGEGIAPLMLRILHEPPPPIPRADVPPQVFDVIVHAMAKTPEQRFATAVEFARALQRVQGELGLPVTDLVVGTGAHPSPGPGLPGPPLVPEWAPTASDRHARSLGRTGPTTPHTGPTAPHMGPHTGPHSGSHTGPTTPHTGPPGPPPLPERPGDGPRRGLVVAAGVALVGGLALGVGALALANRGGDAEGGKQGGSPGAAPQASQTAPQAQHTPVPAEDLAALRPRGLTVRQAGRTAVLRWTLPAGARGLPLLVQRQPAGSQAVTTAPAGSRSATVRGLRPKAAACFKVGAVVRLTQGRAPDVAWSAPACLRPAKTGASPRG
ncbi:Serine/threonine protein kinase [Actinomadura meyerae]|uniref:non-specific serine/threonine protein kinase n=1 Tax=Actinomadura meyerae TaxID=240840 RepID=A0A239H788_9ACTN|nr:serine/threonine-protein kinase [Actinomadura meyerae]SNS77269.1 Serine/threonine protein kinase [Actinomadura meyerae]